MAKYTVEQLYKVVKETLRRAYVQCPKCPANRLCVECEFGCPASVLAALLVGEVRIDENGNLVEVKE